MSLTKDFALSTLAALRGGFGFSSTKAWVAPDISLLSGPTPDQLDREISYVPPVDPVKIETIFDTYGIVAVFSDYRIGSSITTYELELPVGTRFNKIKMLKDDIARDLGAPSLRIVPNTCSSSMFNIEIENTDRFNVYFKTLYEQMDHTDLALPFILGEDTYGQAVYEDLARMPHLLVAGQTGSGKSVFLNTTLASLICSKDPSELQLLIVDPKQVEFAAFGSLPHLMSPIASDPCEARELLETAVNEMEHRFGLLKEQGVKKISDYNKISSEPLPYIVFIVDEFADLMMMGEVKQRKDVESKIVRIAQKARGVGIHMILATQKPLAKIVTSLIKANLPARISFSVASAIDSRVVLDENGAEVLTGMGDMLYRDPYARHEFNRIKRIQAPWLSDEDVQLLIQQ